MRSRHSFDRASADRERVTDELTARLRDGGVALDPGTHREIVLELTLANMPVARRIARKFEGRGCDAVDLEQTAYLALVKAAQRFDAAAGHDFLSYVVPCITGEVKRLFRDHGWMVRPPRAVQELQALVEVERTRPMPVTGRPPNDRDVAARLDVPLDAVRQALAARGCFSPTSLDRPVPGTVDLAFADTLVDGRSAQGYASAEARAVLGPGLSALGAADRRLLQLSFVEERTQREIGDELGLSQSQVSRLIQDVLGRLRDHVAGTTRATIGTAA
ncbi:sigma-70 family RNA polymerase sigma factor [Nocardioides hwasunensis]|uniref:Sigma-70 family RNA polymerase sigma factor n=1 Tax=Nocardioides hwasunensis TaxID=397258 RepID=A0ABR8MFK6_9ACTN|nr:sigma-70 family RNA polymerase sigma factor [Nocardioides hwasunensis]MBD3914855.1 sigma-70 family RNA polymerase sigma factor [Nocardioides hwasunensis]